METVLIPAINYSDTTPDGMVLVEVGHHAILDGFVCPFPFKVVPEYWPPHRVNEFSNFCATQYNLAKYGTHSETLDQSTEI